MPSLAPPLNGFPRLVVKGADEAIAFVRNGMDGTLVDRFADVDGRVVFSKVTLGQVAISLVEEAPDWGWISPQTLGGTPIMMQLDLESCDAMAEQMLTHKAEIIVPIENRAYGKREGRLRDPFGHLWILSEDLTT